MAIVVYTETEKGRFKKNAFEVASYARALADELDTTVTALCINADHPTQIGVNGVDKVLTVHTDYDYFEANSHAEIVAQAAAQEAAQIIIVSSSADAKYMASILSIKTHAGYVPNVVGLPINLTPFVIKHTVFSNKAFSNTTISSEMKIIGVSNNAFGVYEKNKDLKVEDFIPTKVSTKVTQISLEKVTGKATIADADVVVSAGRGLKGPENWGMVEELAEILGAATACSKPVSDMGWRPHSEHVGQTGKPVATNLYIAIGISGAIQHLAGVNSSKVKVVINTDPDAPFFKAADYGIIGDAFEVVPQLIKKLKKFKSSSI